MPLLTELKNNSVKTRDYIHAAPDGAVPRDWSSVKYPREGERPGEPSFPRDCEDIWPRVDARPPCGRGCATRQPTDSRSGFRVGFFPRKAHKKAMRPFKIRSASQRKTVVVGFLKPQQYGARVLLLLSLALSSITWGASPEQLLLKDFKPRSIYRVPASKVERARFPVIDMHTHDNAKTDEQVAAWVRAMDELGIEKSTILSQAHGQAFDAVIPRYKKYPGRFSVWCGFDFTGYDQPGFGPAAVAELERCFKAGAEGVGEMGAAH